MKIYRTNRVAIRTTFYGPTNHLGSRYKADAGDGRTCWVGADPRLHDEDNHIAAAVALCKRMGWDSRNLISGCMGYDMVFLMIGPNVMVEGHDFSMSDAPSMVQEG